MPRVGRLATVVALTLAVASMAAPMAAAAAVDAARMRGDRVEVSTEYLRLVFSLDGANPVRWEACHPVCDGAAGSPPRSVAFTTENDPPAARLTLRGAGLDVDLDRLRFTAEITENDHARVVTFRSKLPVSDVAIEKSFEVSRRRYETVMTARLVGAGAATFGAGRRFGVELSAGAGLFPAPAPGFSAALEGLRRVVVVDGNVATIAADPPGRPAFHRGDWAGFRSRFWTLLLRAGDPATLEARSGATAPLLVIGEPGAISARVTVYSGPVEYTSLTRSASELGRLLFSGLWLWLRVLSLALLFILRGLTAIAGHPGLAIIALAATVKVLMLPLSTVADRLQQQVSATQAVLQPRIDAIKAAHRGEARTRQIVELYRAERVHPLYTLKSLVGVLIQIPVFIAVFDMLAENFALYRVPFLWIADLSRPDELFALPVGLPFFGQHVNLLPFLMTGIALTASLRFESPVLTPALLRRQRRSLVGMAVAFFVLFYTFPAGMVLYWTSTNALQLASREVGRWRRRGRPSPPAADPARAPVH